MSGVWPPSGHLWPAPTSIRLQSRSRLFAKGHLPSTSQKSASSALGSATERLKSVETVRLRLRNPIEAASTEPSAVAAKSVPARVGSLRSPCFFRLELAESRRSAAPCAKLSEIHTKLTVALPGCATCGSRVGRQRDEERKIPAMLSSAHPYRAATSDLMPGTVMR